MNEVNDEEIQGLQNDRAERILNVVRICLQQEHGQDRLTSRLRPTILMVH